MRWAKYVARMGKGVYQIVGKREGKRPLVSRCHWCDFYINMELQAVG
jgi:hypothetical protein